ncbi:MAG TPA: hypothetical protein VI299_05095, partial [Polyangiales bacterium]
MVFACGDDAEPDLTAPGPEAGIHEPVNDAATPTMDATHPTNSDAGGDASRVGDASSPDAAVSPVVSRGLSAGCGKAPPSGDGTAWREHDLTVSGVASAYLEGGAKYGQQHGFDFTHRNYFLRLPKDYAPAKPYALVISAGGCGATDGLSGKGGGSNPLSDDQSDAVQVGLSYVYPDGAGACFADGSSDTPDLPYFDAVLAEIDARYCFDRDQVFVSGFSSGAWETYMLACARGGVIRAIGTQAGGLRKDRPQCSNVPVAAFLTAGIHDDNPIMNVDRSGFDTGSGHARDVILKTNGCSSSATEPYVTPNAPADWNCVRYTSCPAAY